MIKAHTVTKRGKVLLTGTERETPTSFKAVKKRISPTKKAKKAEKKSHTKRDNVIPNKYEIFLLMIIKTKNPRHANAVRMRFPDQGSVSSRPFLYTEALAAQQNDETTAKSTPVISWDCRDNESVSRKGMNSMFIV
jgi:hypothetical protein